MCPSDNESDKGAYDLIFASAFQLTTDRSAAHNHYSGLQLRATAVLQAAAVFGVRRLDAAFRWPPQTLVPGDALKRMQKRPRFTKPWRTPRLPPFRAQGRTQLQTAISCCDGGNVDVYSGFNWAFGAGVAVGCAV